MDLQFGKNVYEQSLKLQEQGKDANQIAKILFDQDSKGHNYGIGIVLDGNGQAMATSSTLLEYLSAELELSKRGRYMNSNALMEELKIATLKWQRIPEKYWGQFKLAIPSDAGTGAVKTSVEIALMLDSRIRTLGIEEFGWPAYKAIAKTSRVRLEEFAADGAIAGEDILPLYQAGPMNTTGFVQDKEIVKARAESAANSNTFVILDRAYPGFEFARLLATKSYDEIMRMSYEIQIHPFIEQGVSFCLAIGPTKAFVSFALRPCGLLLLFCPDSPREQEMTSLLNTTIRARGSSFEHPATRAFAKAMSKDLARLEAEHQAALERVAEAEAMWRKLVQGTPIEYLYADNYAGLFRNPQAREDAPIYVYNEHIYPVFANQRCRQNVTGIPYDEQLAQKHVKVFAEQCY
jgi:hypothetical protein